MKSHREFCNNFNENRSQYRFDRDTKNSSQQSDINTT